MVHLKTRYVDEKVSFVCGWYHDGSMAIRALSGYGEVVMTITVCVDEPAPEGHIWVKSWSENEGILEWLIENGFVIDSDIIRPVNFVNVHLCELTEKFTKLLLR